MESKQHIIFFDGVCNLCNRSVQSIIKKDKNKIFKFAPLQSAFAQKFFNEHRFHSSVDSIIYWNGEKFYTLSSAVFKITRHLKFPLSLLQIFGILPKFLTDALYLIIAKHRYSWFGRRENCMIPSTELKDRFLE